MDGYNYTSNIEKLIRFNLKNKSQVILRFSEIKRVISDKHKTSIICYDGVEFETVSDIDTVMGLLKC